MRRKGSVNKSTSHTDMKHLVFIGCGCIISGYDAMSSVMVE